MKGHKGDDMHSNTKVYSRVLISVVIIAASNLARAGVLVPIDHQAIYRVFDPISNGLSSRNVTSTPLINPWGELVWQVLLRGPDIEGANDRAKLSFRNNGFAQPRLEIVAREGDSVAGSAVPITSFGTQTFIDRFGNVSLGLENSRLLTQASGGGLEFLIGNEGNSATEEVRQFRPTSFSSSGNGSFAIIGEATRRPSELQPEIYAVNQNGSPNSIVKANDLAIGLTGGNRFRSFESISQNNRGVLFFKADHPATPSDGRENQGIWRSDGGLPSPYIIESLVADSYQAGARFTDIMSFISINNREDVLFSAQAELTSPTHDATTESGVYVSRSNATNIEAAWIYDEPVSVAGETTILMEAKNTIMNGRGEAISYISESPTNGGVSKYGLFRKKFGQSIQRVFADGDQVPEAPEGVQFEIAPRNGGNPQLSGLFSNRRGDLIFQSKLSGPGINASNNSALFYSTPTGELLNLLQLGNNIDVSLRGKTADLRSIKAFDLLSVAGSGGEEGNSTILNDRGEFTLRINFNGLVQNEGIFRFRLPSFNSFGDFNRDLITSQADLDLALLSWGEGILPEGWLNDGSFDGQISQNELDEVLLNWGNGLVPSAVAIPEPTSIATIGLLGFLSCARRRVFGGKIQCLVPIIDSDASNTANS